MAINFLNTINFNQNELQNVVIDPTGSAPTTTEGAMYYDTSDDIMYYRNASAWVPMDGSGTGVVTAYKVYTYEGDDAANHDIAWAGGVTPTLTTTASKTDIICILWDKHLEKAYGTITHNF